MTYTVEARVYIDWTSAVLASAASWEQVPTQLVRHIEWAYGRSRGVDDFQPGAGAVLLDNKDGRFDPSNTTSPHYPNVRLKRRIKVTAYIADDGVFYSEVPLAYGWIERWPQTWKHRTSVLVEVGWTDFLGIGANHHLPASTWDYRIQEHVTDGDVVAWYRWGDQSNDALDSSANAYHGRYVIAEGVEDPTSTERAPAAVAKAAHSDPVIPAVDRPGLDIGKMIAETGQPAVAPTGTWRFPSVVCHQATALWGVTEFSVETWVKFRAGFSLSAAGLASAATPRVQWLAWWGTPLSHASGFGISGNLSGAAGRPTAASAYYTDLGFGYPEWLYIGDGTAPTTPSIDDGQAHHLVWTVTNITSPSERWRVETYVDGVFYGSPSHEFDFSKAEAALGYFYPAQVGFQHKWTGGASTLDMAAGSTIGDLIFYNRVLTSGEVTEHYNAGRHGRLTGTGDLRSGEAVEQALEMIGYGSLSSFDTGYKDVAGAALDGRDVISFAREAARSEQGAFFQQRSGTVIFSDESWRREGNAATVQYTLTDGDPSALTGIVVQYAPADCDFEFDDGNLINAATVTFAGGDTTAEDATSIAEHGRYDASVDTMLLDPEAARDLATFKVWAHRDPQLEVGQVSFDALAGDDHIQAAAIFTEVPIRVRLIRTRPDGSEIDGEYIVEHVTQRVEPGNGLWTVALGMTRADWPGTPFIVGTSLVGSTTEHVWY